MNPELRTPRDASPSRGTSTARNRLLALIVSLAVMAVASVGFAGTASAAPPPWGCPCRYRSTPLPLGASSTGAFDIQRIVVENGALQVVGTFTGEIYRRRGHRNASTQAVTTAGQRGRTPPARSSTWSWVRWT